MQWQLYWKSWGLNHTVYYDLDYSIHEHFWFIGPLQLRYYSNRSGW